MEKTIKGMFLKNLINMVKQDKGAEGLKKLEQEFGDKINFSAMRDYPIETEMKLHKAIMKVIFGEESLDNYRKLGQMNMHYYANSIVGKTIFSLVGKDLKSSALRAQKFINTIASGIKIEFTDLDETKMKTVIQGLPYPIEYYQGIFEESLKYFKKIGTVTTEKTGPDEYTYIADWE